jgi:hypothetical protein
MPEIAYEVSRQDVEIIALNLAFVKYMRQWWPDTYKEVIDKFTRSEQIDPLVDEFRKKYAK